MDIFDSWVHPMYDDVYGAQMHAENLTFLPCPFFLKLGVEVAENGCNSFLHLKPNRWPLGITAAHESRLELATEPSCEREGERNV